MGVDMIVPQLETSLDAVIDYVQELGHADLASYQEWYGLKPDGIAGPLTSSLLSERRCGVPDFAGAEEAQWPRSCMAVPVSYFFDSIDENIAAQAWALGVKFWNDICGIELELLDTINRPLADGKIWATDGPLPGPTLAWSELARDRCDDRLQQRYDTIPVYTVDFLAKIIAHELGHGLGIQHSSNRLDIMFASIGDAPLSSYPGPGDRRESGNRYGEPTEPPDEKPEVLYFWAAEYAGQKFMVTTSKKPDGGWKT